MFLPRNAAIRLRQIAQRYHLKRNSASPSRTQPNSAPPPHLTSHYSLNLGAFVLSFLVLFSHQGFFSIFRLFRNTVKIAGRRNPALRKIFNLVLLFLFVFDMFYREHEGLFVNFHCSASRTISKVFGRIFCFVSVWCFFSFKRPNLPHFHVFRVTYVQSRFFLVFRFRCFLLFFSRTIYLSRFSSLNCFTVKMAGRAQSDRGEHGVVRGQLVRGDQHVYGGGRVPPGKRRRQLELASEDLWHDGSGTW